MEVKTKQWQLLNVQLPEDINYGVSCWVSTAREVLIFGTDQGTIYTFDLLNQQIAPKQN